MIIQFIVKQDYHNSVILKNSLWIQILKIKTLKIIGVVLTYKSLIEFYIQMYISNLIYLRTSVNLENIYFSETTLDQIVNEC
jgi:hypothetical protein